MTFDPHQPPADAGRYNAFNSTSVKKADVFEHRSPLYRPCAGLRARRVEGIVTARGNFHAQLTRVDFDRLLMQRASETLPRVLRMSTKPGRAAIVFATDQYQPPIHVSGLALSSGDIIFWDSELPGHHRAAAACQWGSMSLAKQDLVAAGEAIAGHGLTPPSVPHRIRPPAPILSWLLRLHATVGRLAKTAPDILAKPEVRQAMEHALVEAMVSCLAGSDPIDMRRAHRRRATVMGRLEEALQASPKSPLHMADLCEATGVSYPTLRACCQEHLGMSPKRHLLLRRLHLARQGLLRADPEKTNVTEIATNYGFWELGRFSVVYRSLFGESPSATLRRPPDDPKAGGNRRVVPKQRRPA